jgi:hypothetical protein
MANVVDEWLPSPEGRAANWGGGTLRQNLEVPLADMALSVSDFVIGGPGGQLAAIAGRHAILVLDLDNPWQPISKLSFPAKWCAFYVNPTHHCIATESLTTAARGRRGTHGFDTAPPLSPLLSPALLCAPGRDKVCLAWNSSAGHQSRLASSNQRDALVWDVDVLGPPALAIANASKSPLTGVAWCPADPHLLATCSGDPAVNLFDVRAPLSSPTSSSSSSSAVAQRPNMCLKGVKMPGGSVVAWNKCHGWTLASAHNNQLWLWDIRGGTGSAAAPPPTPLPMIATRSADGANDRAAPSLAPQSSLPLRSARDPRDVVKSPVGPLPIGAGAGSGSAGYALGSFMNHTKRILDLDWAPHSCYELATASADLTVKFWDLGPGLFDENDFDDDGSAAQRATPARGQPSVLLSHGTGVTRGGASGAAAAQGVGGGGGGGGGDQGEGPVNKDTLRPFAHLAKHSTHSGPRAERCIVGSLKQLAETTQVRYTPFGRGIVTITHGFGENVDAQQTLRLWSLGQVGGQWQRQRTGTGAADLPGPDNVCVFKGHAAAIVGFDWRKCADLTEVSKDLMAYQMVSINKDLKLRFHAIEWTHLEACGAKDANAAKLLQAPDADAPKATAAASVRPLSQATVLTMTAHATAHTTKRIRGIGIKKMPEKIQESVTKK